jgi:menaquinone-specific isochorismate synthase
MSDASRPPACLAELVRAARAACTSSAAHSATVLRVEVSAPGLDPLAWLAAQPEEKRGYWADRDGEREVALVGEADEIKGMSAQDYQAWSSAVAERLERALGDVRYYGGFRFGPWHEKDRAWQPFGAYRFILPRFELARHRGGDTTLALNLVRDAQGHWPSLHLEQLVASGPFYVPPSLPSVLGRKNEPDAAAWSAAVERALAAIQSGEIAKVVLARRALLLLSAPADPLALLHGIRRESGPCFQFCGSHGAGFAFVGASPERLYRRSGRQLTSEAVAGTRPRGKNADEDARLESDLLHSTKEEQEHRLVRDRIVHDLTALSREVRSLAAPEILKLGRVQHLRTPICAELKPETSDAELLACLHPTPATAGEPVEAALRLLGQWEAFDRGWYAGPVGWVARDAAEFAVALRCGLVAQSNLILFAGAGIVLGSKAAAEAEEIENKLALFLRLLNAS